RICYISSNTDFTDYTVPTPGDLTTAVSNMETAYTDAAGRATPDYTELGAGDISGMTLYPGLYKWGTGVIINNGVTLDCQGDANAVYIFQIGDTLTVGNGAIVTLSNSCLAKNIFWQVAGQTTLGTTTVFNGTILDQVAIVLNNGGTLNGRALSQTAVTLIGNSVNDVNGVVDTTAPIIDLNSTIPSTTIINDTNASIDVNSNERVTCRYNINSDINYALMNTGSTFDSNGIISLVDLIGGTDYNLFVRCRDSAGNDSNGSKLFSFTTVGDTTKPIISLSGLTKTTNSAQVTINTNEGVTCRRSTSDLNYDLMPTDVNLVITTSSGTGSGAISLSGLTASTAYNFYVVCRDSNNNDSNATVSFSTNAQSSGGGSSGGSGLAPCTSYTYSNWNVCDANGIQTRTIVSSVPTWCTGKPILSQTCNVAPIENPTTPVVTPTQPETSTPTTPVVTPTQPETSTPIVPGTGLVTATTPSIDWVMVAIILILIAAIAGAGYVVVRNNQRIEAEKQYVSEKENESARKLKK
ncbi:MAG: ice-binding family protein, partial [archaeon]